MRQSSKNSIFFLYRAIVEYVKITKLSQKIKNEKHCGVWTFNSLQHIY